MFFFRVKLFWTHPEMGLYFYIICYIRFKNKTYGLNLLIIFELQIELRL
jgi:hypothetical protein